MAPAFSKIFTLDEQMIKNTLGGNPYTCEVKRYECCVCMEEKIHYPQDNRSVKCWTCKDTFTCAECCEEIQVINSTWVAETRVTENMGELGTINHHNGYGQSCKMEHKCPVCRTEFDDTFHEDITDWVELIRKEFIRIIKKENWKSQLHSMKWLEMMLFHGDTNMWSIHASRMGDLTHGRMELALDAGKCHGTIKIVDVRHIDGAYDILRDEWKKGIFFTGRTDVRKGGLRAEHSMAFNG